MSHDDSEEYYVELTPKGFKLLEIADRIGAILVGAGTGLRLEGLDLERDGYVTIHISNTPIIHITLEIYDRSTDLELYELLTSNLDFRDSGCGDDLAEGD